MSKILKALRILKVYVDQSTSRRTTILRGAGEPGHRAAPARGGNHDAKIGCRLDTGATVEKDGKKLRRYKFQLNANAEDSTLRKLAAKNSHKVYSYADVEMKEHRTEEEAKTDIEDFFSQLETNMVDKS